MDSLQSLDVALFRFVNVSLKNGFLDWLLPFFNSNLLFVPVLTLLAIWLIWRGGVRGRLLVFFLLLTFVIGDPVIVNSLKKLIARPRPYSVLAHIHLLVGRTGNPSMPSGHAANWFAGTLVAFVYYRRTIWFMLPIAVIEAFSRVYLGVHYPSDVLAGSAIGAAYAALILGLSDAVWQFVGRRWFPIWWTQLPSLTSPPQTGALRGGPPRDSAGTPDPAVMDRHWVRLAYVLIGALLIGHLGYLAANKIELTEDEAYQWLWSKHLALSYYSKPPLIAYTQFVGTHLWGDREFGVRFFAPVLAALGSLLVVRFLARQANGFVACLAILVASATPLLMVGATLMTIDSLSVLFWVAAMVAGWNAVQRDSTRWWLWTGLWMGLGFLSKYTALFQWLSLALFFVFHPKARSQLRRPGPYLALLINLLCLLPVVIWNAQNHWITLLHLANRGGLDKNWQPTLRFLWDFLIAEAFLLNPIFFLGAILAAVAFWKRPGRDAFAVYLFSMGAPLFLFYLAFTLRSRVQPNWIAPSVLPLWCLMLIYWERWWRNGTRAVPHWLMAAMTLGWLVIVPLHDTQLIGKMFGRPLSVPLDPLTRVLGWKEMARTVEQARRELVAKDGKPAFIIAAHYGTTSLLTFYIPEAKAGVPDRPLVYCISSDEPENQFFFWPGYQARKGQNALYIAPVDRFERTPPASLQREFASVTDLGMRDILYKDRVFHQVQLFACRNLR
jgi:4-amino-4-deoxy-L-arabinose transferase-like glycosyltransferase/membrane-associated phospholipid phosphatase